MPAKSFVMAFVLSGWLVALVAAGLIVAYTSFFGIAVLGVIVLCFSVIVDQDRDGAVGTGITPLQIRRPGDDSCRLKRLLVFPDVTRVGAVGAVGAGRYGAVTGVFMTSATDSWSWA